MDFCICNIWTAGLMAELGWLKKAEQQLLMTSQVNTSEVQKQWSSSHDF